MPWTAAAIVGGAYLSSQASGNAAQSAANTQSAAANASTQLQRDIYNQNRQDLEPYRTSGSQALGELQWLLGVRGNGQFDGSAPLARQFSLADFTADPGYQWRVQQGQDAILARASSLGGVNSGATLKALSDYTSGQATGTFNDAYSRWIQQNQQLYGRLAGLVDTGASASGMTAGLGQNFGAAAGANITGAGNAQAAAQVAAGNATSGAIQSIQNQFLYGMNGKFSNPFGSAPSYSLGDYGSTVPIIPDQTQYA